MIDHLPIFASMCAPSRLSNRIRSYCTAHRIFDSHERSFGFIVKDTRNSRCGKFDVSRKGDAGVSRGRVAMVFCGSCDLALTNRFCMQCGKDSQSADTQSDVPVEAPPQDHCERMRCGHSGGWPQG